MDMNLSKLQDIVKDREAWRATKSQTQLSGRTTTRGVTDDNHGLNFHLGQPGGESPLVVKGQ